jgi:hypothetical protein
MRNFKKTRLTFLWIILSLFALAVLISFRAEGGGVVAAIGNHPPNRVVWLHYDYMVAPDHSHAPDPRAIQIVVEAFQSRGITLHIDPIHNAVPERKVVTLQLVNPACAGPDAVDIHDLRATYFQPHGNHTWHYAVFGHFTTCPDTEHCSHCPPDETTGGRPDPTATGVAELPGRNFAVAGGNLDGRLAQDASTFMHELGHNFGLQHGGNISTNRKPNYVSVMNYAYLSYGILSGEAPGSSIPTSCFTDRDCGLGGYCDLEPRLCFRVDYSAHELPALNEDALDENVGVSGNPDDTDIIFYFVPGAPTVELLGPSYGPIDWNNDGDFTETGVKVDINNSGGVPEILAGFNDWAYLQAYLNTPEYRNGVVRQNPATVSCASGR